MPDKTPAAKPDASFPKDAKAEADLPQAEHVGDGQTGADGTQPDFTNTGYAHPDVKKYSHGGSATETQKPVASANPVASVGTNDPRVVD